MARTKEQNDRMALATKKKIVEAGLKLFSQKGFTVTGIKEIAQAAGISTGLIYRHFSTKEELFGELIEHAVRELSAAIRLLDSYALPIRAFEKMTAVLLDDIESSEELSSYFLLVSRSILEVEALPAIDKLKNENLALFDKAASLIEKGQKAGEFKQGDPYTLSLLYFSLIQGMANMKLFMGDQYIAPDVETVMAVLVD